MALPITRVTMPTDLAGVTNGKLQQGLLTPIYGGGQLHHLAARAWNALVAASWFEVGLPLTFTYGGTYRNYGQQETLFRQRYEIGGPGGGCKTWQGLRWCKKNAAMATAATPGTSNHGWGLAIDAAYDKDLTDGIGPDDAAAINAHPGWSWLLANAARFGFSWELLSEPWHIRYVTGDAVPAAVLAFENPPTPPNPTPTPIPPSAPGDDDMSKITDIVSVKGAVFGVIDNGVIGKVWIATGGSALENYAFRHSATLPPGTYNASRPRGQQVTPRNVATEDEMISLGPVVNADVPSSYHNWARLIDLGWNLYGWKP